MWRRCSLTTKIVLGAAALAVVASLLGSRLNHQAAVHARRAETRQHLLAVASSLAAEIKPADLGLLDSPEATRGPEFRRLRELLGRSARAVPGIRFAYLLRRRSGGGWEYIARGGEEPGSPRVLPGQPCPERESEAVRSALWKPAVEPRPIRDEAGIFLSGYAPVRGPEGNANAVIGVDMSVDHLERVERDLLYRGLQSALAAVFASALLALLVAMRVTRSIRRVADGLRSMRPESVAADRRRARDEITELVDAFNDLTAALVASEERSRRDVLTGLANRTSLEEVLAREIDLSAATGSPLALLMLDLDHFKRLNDRCGHLAGDQVLQAVGRALLRAVRDGDLVARYGGEEFTVVLPHTSETIARGIAERIREEVAGLVVEVGGFPGEPVTGQTISIGLACYPEHARDAAGLLRSADAALYQAKRLSRNRVCRYESRMDGPDPHAAEDRWPQAAPPVGTNVSA